MAKRIVSWDEGQEKGGASLTNTPALRLTDLEAVSRCVDAHAALGHERPWVMCDSTFATPYHQRCLETGVDVAIHSATK